MTLIKLCILASKLLFGYILRCIQCSLKNYIKFIKEDLEDHTQDTTTISQAVSRGRSLIELCKQVTNMKKIKSYRFIYILSDFQTEKMLGGLIVWQTILRLVDITCGIYLCAVIGSVFRGSEINFVALASLAANGSLVTLGYYGIKPLYMLGQVIIYLHLSKSF